MSLFDGKVGGNSPLYSFSSIQKQKNVDKNVDKTKEVKTSQPIDLVSNKTQIDRKDLGNLSPYAGLIDLKPKTPAGSVESYMEAAPELSFCYGEFTISNGFKKEADEYLGALVLAIQDYGEVESHLKESPYDIFA